MQSSVYFALAFLGVLTLSTAQTNFSPNQILTGLKTGITSNKETRLIYRYSTSEPYYPVFTFSLFPCFGQENWYVGYGFVPVPSNVNNTCSLAFTGYDVGLNNFLH